MGVTKKFPGRRPIGECDRIYVQRKEQSKIHKSITFILGANVVIVLVVHALGTMIILLFSIGDSQRRVNQCAIPI